MLQIYVPASEWFKSETNEFFNTKATTLTLEHSLISISKWESKWHKPFISDEVKTREETLDYIRCMTLTQNVDPLVYHAIPPETYSEIEKYIMDPMTATTITEPVSGKHKRKITSELIYYWMIAFNIPAAYEKWHLNRLLTLIKICDIKNSPSKKMSEAEIISQNRELNQARMAALHKKG